MQFNVVSDFLLNRGSGSDPMEQVPVFEALHEHSNVDVTPFVGVPANV